MKAGGSINERETRGKLNVKGREGKLKAGRRYVEGNREGNRRGREGKLKAGRSINGRGLSAQLDGRKRLGRSRSVCVWGLPLLM